MKFAPLILKHLRKNWIRTLSTVLAMSVCIFLICVLQTVLAAVNFGLHSGSTRRLVVRDYVSLANNLPISYKQKISALPGVTDSTIVTWFGGRQGDDFKNFFANLAVEPEAFLRIYPEIMLPEDQKQKWLGDLRGCIIGRKLADRMGWKVGSTLQLESFIPPYRVGKPFEFVVDGIYDTNEAKYPGTNLDSMYFNFKYLYEATGERIGIGTLTVQIDDASHAGAISKEIDEHFENSDNPTKTETEQAFRAGFVSLAGNLALLLNVIGMAVAFTILLVTANTMSIAVRERQQEIAVLKTLGFSSGLVMTLILSEALLLGLMGGLLGIFISRAIIAILKDVPFLGDILRGFPNLGLSPSIAALGVAVALLLGLLAGFVPALLAYRARITEALRQV
ncbi:MAG TPA: FtsX-like permease family protein [Candidatus Eisenbacteria bacterium]|nr:FtsX-like permease family protein [Candidatus Eisenbacteria bacterium]